MAGDLLVRKWEMGDQLGNSVLSHHAPDVDDGLSFLVGVADVIGQILYPLPRDSAYPLAKALEDEDWDTARPFLPEGFLEQPLMSPTELATLVRTVGPRVRHFTEEMRRSMDAPIRCIFVDCVTGVPSRVGCANSAVESARWTTCPSSIPM